MRANTTGYRKIFTNNFFVFICSFMEILSTHSVLTFKKDFKMRSFVKVSLYFDKI